MTDPKWPIGKATETPGDDEAEVAGHGIRVSRMVDGPAEGDDPEAEVEGHGRNPGVIEQPTPEAEAEGSVRPGQLKPRRAFAR